MSNRTTLNIDGTKLNKMLGIPYEAYKPEEPKPEEPTAEAVPVTTDMQTIVAMLGEICNNMIVVNRKLDEIIQMWGDC